MYKEKLAFLLVLHWTDVLTKKYFIKRVKQIWNWVSKKVLLILEIRRRQ